MFGRKTEDNYNPIGDPINHTPDSGKLKHPKKESYVDPEDYKPCYGRAAGRPKSNWNPTPNKEDSRPPKPKNMESSMQQTEPSNHSNRGIIPDRETAGPSTVQPPKDKKEPNLYIAFNNAKYRLFYNAEIIEKTDTTLYIESTDSSGKIYESEYYLRNISGYEYRDLNLTGGKD